MFTNFLLNGSNFNLFQFKNRWYFDLNHFCSAMKLSKEFSDLRDSLVDYEKSIRQTPRQKTFFIVFDFESVKKNINESNQFQSKKGLLINKNVENFINLIKNVDHFVAIDFVFFCQYLQVMYQKWDSKRESLTPLEFKSHLEKRCLFWSKILDSLPTLQPLIDFYHHHRKPLPLNAEKETQDLLEYLELLKNNTTENNNVETKTLQIGEKNNFLTTDQNNLLTSNQNNLLKTDQNNLLTTDQNNLLTTDQNNLLISSNQNNLLTTDQNNLIQIQQNSPNKCKPMVKKRTLTIRDRIAIASDQNWECFYCLKLLDECFQVDHIERFCESGNDHHSNLWALCASCHAKKDEWDRKRRKTNIWSDYRQLSTTEKASKREEILSKIQNL